MRKFCLVNHTSLGRNYSKMPVRDLFGNREFHVPLWSMIYVALKNTLSVSEKESQVQWHVNYGAECKVESLFPTILLASYFIISGSK